MFTITDGYSRTECRCVYEQIIHVLVATDNLGIESVSHNNQDDGNAQYEKKEESTDYLKQPCCQLF